MGVSIEYGSVTIVSELDPVVTFAAGWKAAFLATRFALCASCSNNGAVQFMFRCLITLQA